MLTSALADVSAWPADCRDTCGNIFGQSLRAFTPPIPANAHVLEIGCCEFDALKIATTAWPEMTFTGIDWRPSKAKGGRETRIQGDVMTADFAPASFDWIYSVSAIEHIGLGHYKADPKADDGDIVAMRNAYRWLKPGGWMYFDVPWNEGTGAYEVVRTSHRVYDDTAAWSRLLLGHWIVRWTGVYGRGGEPVANPHRLKGGESFYYKAFWLQKD